ncbi:MAG: prepilin peptidase [Alphaproteobacteria bacterium]|nr:prepilin peptidase [Alphaproteobacteria bacterium]
MEIFGEYSYYYFIILMILLFVFCLGSIIGSFLNVVILRAFSNESIVMPPSKCPKCGNRLKWWHNIPILSYILLRGKCYFCKEKISIQYPVIEFITGILFVLVFIRYGIQINTLFAFAIISILLVLSVTDIKEKVVFDGHTYSLIAIGLIYNLYLTGMEVYEQVNTVVGFPSSPMWFAVNPLTNSLLGILLGVVIMEVVARIGYLIAGNRAFGEGDTYIAAGLGAAFGWQNVLLILVMSVIIQLLFTLPIFLKNQWQGKHYITVFSLLLFIVYAAFYNYLFYITSYLDNSIVMCGALFGLVAIGVVACWNTLKGLKGRENLTFLPFGPALALAGAIVLLVL